jgi:hypothetical protein
MFETSKDILLLVIAFCVLWFTVFLCWLLYYFISMVGSVRKIVKSVQEKIDKIDELIDLVKDKVNSSAAYLPLIVDGVGKIVKHFKSKKSDEDKDDKKEK